MTERGYVMDDLQERVQARINEVEQQWVHSPLDWAEYFFPTLPDSWRERWERHQPWSLKGEPKGALHQLRLRNNLDRQLWCRYCSDPEDGTEWPCPDALAVLREIGIEP